MRTTLIIDDQVMKSIKTLAVRRRTTLSSLVEAFLRQGLAVQSQRRQPLAPLPTFSLGPSGVNIADRDELYRVMDGES